MKESSPEVVPGVAGHEIGNEKGEGEEEGGEEGGGSEKEGVGSGATPVREGGSAARPSGEGKEEGEAPLVKEDGGEQEEEPEEEPEGEPEEEPEEVDERGAHEKIAALAASSAAASSAAALPSASASAHSDHSTTKALIELAVKKERSASSRQILEMQAQLEEARRRLQQADVRIEEQHRQAAKPPKLISVGVEFMDADVSMATSEGSNTTDGSEDSFGIGFGVDDGRDEEKATTAQSWLAGARMRYGVEGVSERGEARAGAEVFFEKRRDEGFREREVWLRGNGEGNRGGGRERERARGGELLEERESNGRRGNAGSDRMTNATVAPWQDRVTGMAGGGGGGRGGGFNEDDDGSLSPNRDRNLTPERKQRMVGGGPVPSSSPTRADFLNRAGRILGENLSPERSCELRTRGSVAASYATVDVSSCSENGSIRSLGTAEVFSPNTSYGATRASVSAANGDMLFSREVMEVGASFDTKDTGTEDGSVRASMSMEGGEWTDKRGRKGMDKYYSKMLDESFEGGRRISKMAEVGAGKVELSRGARHDKAKWDRLYEEQYSGSSSEGDDSD